MTGMAAPSQMHKFEGDGISLSYIDEGPQDGPLIIFVHGWPGIAETWKRQTNVFQALGFRVVAPDMRGYGNSTATRNVRDYSLERLVADMVGLLAHLERDDAIWVGHDWGSGVVWALAAHHPEICIGVVNLCVPYRTLEFGYHHMIPLANQQIYPRDEYPYAQWEYMAYYEKHADKAVSQFDQNSAQVLKLLYGKSNPATYGKPSRTSRVLVEGGWFGGMSNLPDFPLEKTVMDEPLYENLKESQARNTFFSATSYYLNHDVNQTYGKSAKNEGFLEMPVLFIGAKYDATCATSNSRLSEPMRRYCSHLTECTVDGGHWVQLECPTEVNSALLRWIAHSLPGNWPFNYTVPLIKSYL